MCVCVCVCAYTDIHIPLYLCISIYIYLDADVVDIELFGDGRLRRLVGVDRLLERLTLHLLVATLELHEQTHRTRGLIYTYVWKIQMPEKNTLNPASLPFRSPLHCRRTDTYDTNVCVNYNAENRHTTLLHLLVAAALILQATDTQDTVVSQEGGLPTGLISALIQSAKLPPG